MGKRNVIVLSSSEEDENGGGGDGSSNSGNGVRSRSTNRISSRLNPGPSVTTSKPKKRARRRISESNSHPDSWNVELGSFDALCEDFYDGFQEFRKVAGSGPKDKSELWVDKYRPQSLLELAVHKKKVEEVNMWLKERLIDSKDKLHKHALVITGQAGVGKSATIHVIASHLGASLCEWKTPTPTLWQEHMHNLSSGVHYMSKLDEFENFVERIRKYPLLPFNTIGKSMKPSMLLIDDLPLINGKQALGRLRKCLYTLVGSVQIPTIILITECARVDSSKNSARDWEDLLSSLVNAGACKMSFNPITTNSVKKTLSKICKEERCSVTVEQIDQIARVSGGDIRHAITSLQYFCLTPSQLLSFNTIHSNDKADEFRTSDDGFALSFGRDETLSLFHALGKFLHNKRETVNIAGFGQDLLLLKEKFARLPVKMDAPEKVLYQANVQASPVADFLHENVLDFLSDEAVDDAWTVASYLCDADNLATFHGSLWSRTTNNQEVDSISHLAAASVAVRGVLFGGMLSEARNFGRRNSC
ncbi:hypothetical protein AQUCO_00700030v1 [Aquilegia coerulea]|uniref:AAA+ ATPase domain-containing protein n=1 Tax=Aquilegia coerulea TaxID=218851 RepID=A0A2G5EI86_AQUCA|nr:hypothetical protein AQUCO_00700030v1 [Aquilegia coerulea]